MAKVIKQKIHIEKTIFMALACTCLVLCSLYMYFVSASVVQVVMRTETNQEITKLSSEISGLEGRYIEAQHRVSSDIASLQGYQKTDAKIFINKTEGSLVLRTNISE